MKRNAARVKQRAFGKNAEAIVVLAIAKARAYDLGVCIAQRPTPYRVIGRNPRGELRCVPDRSQGVDFAGDVCGRAVYIEAKGVETTGVYYLRTMPACQSRELSDATDRGALAYLVTVREGVALAHAWPAVRGAVCVRHMDGKDLTNVLCALTAGMLPPRTL